MTPNQHPDFNFDFKLLERVICKCESVPCLHVSRLKWCRNPPFWTKIDPTEVELSKLKNEELLIR